jgi:hypothetical protein
VQRKKQRNISQKAIAPQLFAGYTLLTQSTMRRHSAGFYAEREGFGHLRTIYHLSRPVNRSQNIKKGAII